MATSRIACVAELPLRWSSDAWSEGEGVAFLRGGDARSVGVVTGRDRLDRVVVAERRVVRQHEPAHVRLPCERYRVLGGRVPERRRAFELRHDERRAVHEHVGVVRERERVLVARAVAVGAGADAGRAVVGEVRERAAAVRRGDAVAERAPTLVRDLGGGDREPLDVVLARIERDVRPRAAQPVRADREVRAATSPATAPRPGRPAPVGTACTRASSRSAGGKNGRPCTWSQCRWVSRIVPTNGCWPRRTTRVSASSPVPASSSSVGDAVAGARSRRDDVCPPTRSYSGPDTGVDPRTPWNVTLTQLGFVLAPVPGAEFAAARRGRAGPRSRPRAAPTSAPATSTVRRPPSSTARSPRIAPGPSSASGSPSTSTLTTPSSSRYSSWPSWPCSTTRCPSLHLRIEGFSPPRMIVAGHLALQRGLDRGDERGRVLVAPRRVLAERVPVPLLEVGEARLRRELALAVVHPVPREGARARATSTRRGRRRGSSARPSSRRAAPGTARTAGGSRGAGPGRPVRPPTVCTNVADVSVVSGSRRISGMTPAANVASLMPSRTVVAPITTPLSGAYPARRCVPSSTSIHARSRFAKRNASIVRHRVEVVDRVGRRVVVVRDLARDRRPTVACR